MQWGKPGLWSCIDLDGGPSSYVYLLDLGQITYTL